MISNPAPTAISGGTWSAVGGIRSITVNIPNKPADNDLAGIVILGKAGGGQSLTFPDDVFFKGPWNEFIIITTDASNTPLEPNQAYTIGIAAYDEFGTDGIDFGTVTHDVVVLQLETIDIGNDVVDTNNIKNDAVTSAKISSLTADKITAGTITGSTLQTASSGKRFVVSSTDNEAKFWGDRGDSTIQLISSIGISGQNQIISDSFTSTDSNWIFYGNVSRDTTAGILNFTGGFSHAIYENLQIFAGDVYLLFVTCSSYSSGTLRCYLGGYSNGYDVNSATGYVDPVVSTNQTINLFTNDFVGQISLVAVNVSYPYVDDCIARFGNSYTTKKALLAKGNYSGELISAENKYNGGTGVYAVVKENGGQGLWGEVLISNTTTANKRYTGVCGSLFFQSAGGPYTDRIKNFCGVLGQVQHTNGGSAIRGETPSSGGVATKTINEGTVAFSSLGDCDFRGGAVYFKSYSKTALPSAATEGGIIYVSDESGGSVMAFSDGINWRRVTDRAIVS